MTTDIIMVFFSLSWILVIFGCFSCNFPPKNAGCHSRQKRRMQMNVTFYLAWPYIEMVESQSVLLLHWLKLSKFLSSMGYHVYHILFTHSDMLRIRLSHKIEALYPVASICHLTNVPSIFGFSVPYWKLFSFPRFWCLWSWTTIWWMMGILLTPRHLPLLLLC